MEFSEQIRINAAPQDIFSRYRDVTGWAKWDSEVKFASLNGSFKEGCHGHLIPNKGPKVKFTLVKVNADKSFISESNLPLCTIRFSHELEGFESYTNVTHSVKFIGLSSFIFGRIIGKEIKESLPETLQGLKNICE